LSVIRFPTFALAASLAASASLAPCTVLAQDRDAPRTPVDPDAASFATLGGISLAAGLALSFAPDPERADASWRGGILFDEAVRDGLRLRSVEQQEIAATLSDVLLFATIGQAALVDSLLVPLVQGDTDLAWQASFAHALALGITITAGEIVKRAVGRARPYERECAQDPSRPGCGDGDRFASFYSLHSGVAFTSAGFSCAMHLERGLYGDRGADIGSCAASIGMAAATGLLRVAADRHYLTDVLVGAALGFLVGYLVPLAVVPERTGTQGGEMSAPGAMFGVAPMVSPPTGGGGGGGAGGGGTFGLSVFGTF
jgi:membrane-associated phospholipid phosphatase